MFVLLTLCALASAVSNYPYGQGFAPLPQAYPNYAQAVPQQYIPQQQYSAPQQQVYPDFRFQQVAQLPVPAGMERPVVIDPETSMEDPIPQEDDNMMSSLIENPPAPPASTGAPAAGGTAPAPSNCADGDKPCKIGAAKAAGPKDDGRDPKLVAALEAVKSDLMAKGHQLVEEKKWLKEVKQMMTTYAKKVSGVQKSVTSTKETMKDLLKKKRQIENLELQKQLKAKLAAASGDLSALETVISHVKNRANQFMEKKKNVEETIKLINTQLSKLSGKGAEKALNSGDSENTQY